MTELEKRLFRRAVNQTGPMQPDERLVPQERPMTAAEEARAGDLRRAKVRHVAKKAKKT